MGVYKIGIKEKALSTEYTGQVLIKLMHETEYQLLVKVQAVQIF